jgi:hypothetical protein
MDTIANRGGALTMDNVRWWQGNRNLSLRFNLSVVEEPSSDDQEHRRWIFRRSACMKKAACDHNALFIYSPLPSHWHKIITLSCLN